MLVELLTVNDEKTYHEAMESVRQAYLTGKYKENGESFDLPFAAQWNALFPNGEVGGNAGHYNHFCNVTAAMAHIITYAHNNPDKIPCGGFTPQRKLDCMMAAFYHDIGKTVVIPVPRRHGVEGKALFAEPKASVKFRFEEISGRYPGCRIDFLTLSYYAELIGAHDIHGTISTGENGLLSLACIIERFKSLYDDDNDAVSKAVFDLWLLNIADIITSLDKKGEPQDWQDMIPGSLDDKIENFLNSTQGLNLQKDLELALQIAKAEDPYILAKTLSEKHAAHRLQRLVRQSFWGKLESSSVIPDALKTEILTRLDDKSLIAQIREILRSEFGEGYRKMFGTMLQFDYALGFFLTLSQQAIYRLGEELKPGGTFRTGWLYNQKTITGQIYRPEYLNRYNAECTVNNYITVIAGIFGEIHRLTADIENWNIEFEDANKRLTFSKADKLLFFDGPYRAGNARSLLMKEIMLYKS
jgi:hypothetical protein